jgi:hypothetical protein
MDSRMSGAKAGIAMFRKEEDLAEGISADEGMEGQCLDAAAGGGLSPVCCAEPGLKERLETEWRQRCGALGVECGTDVFHREAEVERWMQMGASSARTRRGVDVAAVELMVLVEHVDFARRAERTECEAHGWKRSVEPPRVDEDDELDLCWACETGVSCSEEERRAICDGRVACGEWSVWRAVQWSENIAGRGVVWNRQAQGCVT